ncbi:tRNA-specific 2-thiouridylase [Kandleria vitulina]|jgi:tRNA-specific 2-thiouridylase|uniref:tRNA-specific 2-thiouridylase MnmA n=1 Tax=Kandleria vitulina TaxID=1630 RepID=A0A1H2UP91_9FIRM|nr:tRNA 2-thiouridine(34) synthase MnmA [Kandleria vitulina]SDW57895.1 tRNA-specific 2-thiouridylase [Kandleria vitulina]
MSQRVVLGLSGGVDSAVAAYLLKKQGYEVICVFMRNWDSSLNNDILGNPNNDASVCPQEQDYNDACKVAEHLGLEIRRVDFIKEYWDSVFTYFLEEYAKGRTPNPDILCNKHIKFKAFLDYAKKIDADYIATGHYARVEHHEGEDSVMLRGVDNNKDQTYFLCQLAQFQLKEALFPIGELTKPEVRKIAEELDLPVAHKKDSTGICFIGERDFREFLKNYIPAKPGKIVNYENKEVIGEHQGIMYYTIGQRKGLNIGGKGGPWFVIGKEYDDNILYVAQGDSNDWLLSDEALITDVNWISSKKVEGDFDCTAKFRYRQKDNDVSIRFIDDTTIYVTFKKPVKAVTPGQAAVFYDGDVCLGGGTIEKVYKDNKEIEYL